MTDDYTRDLVLRDLPGGTWTLGLFLGVLGVFIFRASHDIGDARGMAGAGVLIGVSLGVVALARVLTIHADETRGTLTVTYRSLLRRVVTEIPLRQVAAVDIEAVGGGKGGVSYHVVVTEAGGRLMPLRSLPLAKTERLAGRLRELAGVGGSPTFGFDPRYVAWIAPHAGARETAGVRWSLRGVRPANWRVTSWPATRWHSEDQRTEGAFVYVAQKPPGPMSVDGMLLRMGLRLAMGNYGFTEAALPGAHEARVIPLDRRLGRDFAVFTSDPDAAARVLTPPVVELLCDWADRHPLASFQVGGRDLGQLAVLHSPEGVYVVLGGVAGPSHVNELADVGVRLVQAQWTSAA